MLKRDITHLRLFFSRFLAAPDLTGEAQTVWPSHRDLQRDTQRRVGVFVCYSQCKKSPCLSAGGGGEGGTDQPARQAARRRQDAVAVLSPSRLRGINHSLCSFRVPSLLFPNPHPRPPCPPQLPPPPPRCCHCQIRRPRLTKLFLHFAANRESFFFFFCVAKVTEVFCVIFAAVS